jgi:hypothetical protein
MCLRSHVILATELACGSRAPADDAIMFQSIRSYFAFSFSAAASSFARLFPCSLMSASAYAFVIPCFLAK